MTWSQILVLFIAAVLGGALNSVAGGGSFITLPALIFTGVGAKIANATSTVALWPGAVASVGAYRRELVKQKRVIIILFGVTSLVGGVLGAELLVNTSQNTFVLLLPYLLLLATVLFAVSPFVTKHLRSHALQQSTYAWPLLLGISLAQFVIAIYGGYFGGGIGILMLATLGLMGMENINEMNALKTLFASCINGVAVITFIIDGLVYWPQAILMLCGAILGGYFGAYFARKIDQRWVRAFVILVGASMTIYFFIYK